MLSIPNDASAAMLTELLDGSDERFIHNAYQALLAREPDPAGLRYYLTRLGAGISKIEVLGQLLLSKERGNSSTQIAGLRRAILREKLLKAPILGAVLRLGDRISEVFVPLAGPLPVVNALCASFFNMFQALARGTTRASRDLARASLRFHLDSPVLGWLTIAKDTCRVSGWAVDIASGEAVNVRIRVGGAIQSLGTTRRDDVRKEFAHLCALPMDSGFSCVLKLALGIHEMRIEVAVHDGSWTCVRRAILLRVPGKARVQSRKPVLSYRDWARLEQKRLLGEHPDITLGIRALPGRPTFTILVDTRRGSGGMAKTLRSIDAQLYPCHELRFLGGVARRHEAAGAADLSDLSLADVRGDFFVFLRAGQLLARDALYEFAKVIVRHPDADLVYGDEDCVSAWRGRHDPFHKPGWSPDYLETFNYIGFIACLRTSIARGCFDKAHPYDLMLRFTERSTRVRHVARVLGHSRPRHRRADRAPADGIARDIEALVGRLGRTGRVGRVRPHPLHKGCYDIELQLQHSPLVSIVIPTAGKSVTVGDRSINLIENVVHEIRSKSSYQNVEIIVVDNDDLSPGQMQALSQADCKRITYSEPVFNIARKLNLGVSATSGEMLLLMNDDIEILSPDWIERLLEQFEKPHVGVVGAKLLYPNQQTQHVGVVQPFGNPDHVRRSYSRSDPGYFFSTCGVRNYSAVTGALMMTRARTYRDVGGYSDELAVCFNDVDFCMKVRSLERTVVYAPGAELIHMESVSRSVVLDLDELAWFHNRWAAQLTSDEFYNDKFLTVEPPTFVPCVN